jgi:type IV secretion system protein VirB10
LNVLAIAALCAACGNDAPAGNAAPAAPAETPAAAAAEPAPVPAAPELREVTIPAGTTLRLKLQSAVASDTSRVEDTVRAELRQAVAVDGRPVLPAGTEVVGTVTDVKRSGRVKGRALVAYRFNSLRTEGERYDIKTTQLSHQAAATKGQDAKKIGIGAGAGAALGAILGGGSGAAKGAAIGGAGGTGVVLATRGKDVHLGPGAEVTTKLTAPLTVRVKA